MKYVAIFSHINKIKSAGTTWTKEMAWLLQHDLNYEAAMVNSYIRIPYLE